MVRGTVRGACYPNLARSLLLHSLLVALLTGADAIRPDHHRAMGDALVSSPLLVLARGRLRAGRTTHDLGSQKSLVGSLPDRVDGRSLGPTHVCLEGTKLATELGRVGHPARTGGIVPGDPVTQRRLVAFESDRIEPAHPLAHHVDGEGGDEELLLHLVELLERALGFRSHETRVAFVCGRVRALEGFDDTPEFGSGHDDVGVQEDRSEELLDLGDLAVDLLEECLERVHGLSGSRPEGVCNGTSLSSLIIAY